MRALLEQIDDLDGNEVYGRVVGVRGLMVEVAGPLHAMSVGARVVIEAQVQGSVAYGLSAALYGEMPVEKGRMTNLNFDSYEVMRLADFPKVAKVVVATNDSWGRVGEPTSRVAPPRVLTAPPPAPRRRRSSAGGRRGPRPSRRRAA